MTYAIIESGGVQFRVMTDERVKVPRIQAEVGSNLIIPRILIYSDERGVVVGTPVVEGALVKAQVLSHGRSAKIRGFKFRRRKNYRRTWGARAEYSEILITDISAPEVRPETVRPVGGEAVVVPEPKAAEVKAKAPKKPLRPKKVARPASKQEKKEARPERREAKPGKKETGRKGVRTLISKFRPKKKK